MAVSWSIISKISTPNFHHPSSSPSFSTSTFPRNPHLFPFSTTQNFPRDPKISISVSGIWDAITGGGGSSREALIAIRRGMVLFRQGDVLRSVAEFDNAIKLDPRQKAYLWQRGLSLYYLDRFEEGAEQFRIDVAQNPNDTEESIWCFLCEAQLYGATEARRRFLQVGRDPRPVMREAYNMFKDGGDPEKLVSAFSEGRESEYFYASLYAGLYYESQYKNVVDRDKIGLSGTKIHRWNKSNGDGTRLNEADKAKVHLVASCQSPYGLRGDDYMASLAKVHCVCRKWEL